MVKTLCIIQARLTSSRLPNKVLMNLGHSNKSILEHIYERLSTVKNIDKIVVAIPNNSQNDNLEKFIKEKGFDCFRGSEDNVLERFFLCANNYFPKIIVRATSDNPLVDPDLSGKMIDIIDNYDYIHCLSTSLGTSVEVFKMAALEEAYNHATLEIEKEHVTPYIWKKPEKFKIFDFPYNKTDYRLTVDEKSDFKLMNQIYSDLYVGNVIPNSSVYSYLAQHPEIVAINAKINQKSV